MLVQVLGLGKGLLRQYPARMFLFVAVRFFVCLFVFFFSFVFSSVVSPLSFVSRSLSGGGGVVVFFVFEASTRKVFGGEKAV